jgi:hypothetical protein
MAFALVAMRPSNLLLGVSAGAVVYVAALALVGGIRRGQDGLPELRV